LVRDGDTELGKLLGEGIRGEAPDFDVRHEKVAPFLRVRIPPGDFCSRRKQPEQSWR
jgi:hypothetical protein